MSQSSKNKRLLIVDDEEEFLVSSSQALNRRGFTVDVAPNGITALEKLDQSEYDAVVLDVKMPDIDGVEVFRQIQKTNPDLPVILLTGHSSISDAFQTSKEGIADYLSKPIEMDDLAKRINQAIKTFAGRQTSEEGESAPADAGELIRIMIVDDEIEFLDSLKRVFQRRGMDVATAVSGQEAIRQLREDPVEVVILDVKMPGMDGLEVLSYIKRSFPGIEVVLLSGHPSVEAAMKGVKLGASEYLNKPPDIDELEETVKKLHQRRKQWQLEQQQKLIDDIRRRYPD